MTDMMPVDTTQEFVDRAIPLLKEYSDKVDGIKRQVREMRQEYAKAWANENSTDKTPEVSEFGSIYQAELEGLEEYVRRLKPAILQFGQQVSGMIDQGKVTPLMKAELKLRLAELESGLLQLPNLLHAYRFWSPSAA